MDRCEQVVYVVSEWVSADVGFQALSIYTTREEARKEAKRLRYEYGWNVVVEPWAVRGKKGE